ncbi:hypothetical protein Tco_0435415 [Tanacetum coccineum]
MAVMREYLEQWSSVVISAHVCQVLFGEYSDSVKTLGITTREISRCWGAKSQLVEDGVETVECKSIDERVSDRVEHTAGFDNTSVSDTILCIARGVGDRGTDVEVLRRAVTCATGGRGEGTGLQSGRVGGWETVGQCVRGGKRRVRSGGHSTHVCGINKDMRGVVVGGYIGGHQVRVRSERGVGRSGSRVLWGGLGEYGLVFYMWDIRGTRSLVWDEGRRYRCSDGGRDCLLTQLFIYWGWVRWDGSTIEVSVEMKEEEEVEVLEVDGILYGVVFGLFKWMIVEGLMRLLVVEIGSILD